MMYRGRVGVMPCVLAMAIVGLTGCGEAGLTGADQSPEATVTWRLHASEDAGVAPGSVVVEIAGIAGTPRILASGADFSRISLGSITRIILIGELAGKDLLEVRGKEPGVFPTVEVLDASAGSVVGYRRLEPSEVVLEWVEVR